MFRGYDTEENYIRSLMQDYSYHYIVPFDYILRHYGDDEVEWGTLYMEVEVEWDDSEPGYRITYEAPGFEDVDPDEGNGDVDEFYENQVKDIVLGYLSSMGIDVEALTIDSI